MLPEPPPFPVPFLFYHSISKLSPLAVTFALSYREQKVRRPQLQQLRLEMHKVAIQVWPDLDKSFLLYSTAFSCELGLKFYWGKEKMKCEPGYGQMGCNRSRNNRKEHTQTNQIPGVHACSTKFRRVQNYAPSATFRTKLEKKWKYEFKLQAFCLKHNFK